MFLVGLLRPGRRLRIDDYGLCFSRLQHLLDRLKLPAPSLLQSLLPDDDATVQNVLHDRLKHGVTLTLTSNAMNEHRNAWRALGRRFDTNYLNVGAKDRDSPWWGVLCSRKRACLDYHQHVCAGNLLRAVVAGVAEDTCSAKAKCQLVDLHKSLAHLSQGIAGSHGQLLSCTLLPDSDVYVSASGEGDCSRNRCLVGEEYLMLNGFPTRHPALRSVIEETPNNMLKDLGGNSFASTIIVALLASIIFATEMRGEEPQAISSHDDTADAMSLLKRLRTK
jgi:hypothetical protein